MLKGSNMLSSVEGPDALGVFDAKLKEAVVQVRDQGLRDPRCPGGYARFVCCQSGGDLIITSEPHAIRIVRSARRLEYVY